jgi:hypothetical protein
MRFFLYLIEYAAASKFTTLPHRMVDRVAQVFIVLGKCDFAFLTHRHLHRVPQLRKVSRIDSLLFDSLLPRFPL